MEKIVREYFPYITETEAMTFTDCVRCLLAFTTSRFNQDVSPNAIAFLRFCAVKLAEGELLSNGKSICDGSTPDGSTSDTAESSEVVLNAQTFTNKDEPSSFWVPLLAGNFPYNLFLLDAATWQPYLHVWHQCHRLEMTLPLNKADLFNEDFVLF